MYCPKCGAQNDEQAALCDKCGTALQRLQGGTVATPTAQTVLYYAGWEKRIVASFIDGAIFTAIEIVGVILIALGLANGGDASADPDSAGVVYLVFSVVFFAVYFAYFSIMESSPHQATLGKRALDIVVTDIDGKRVSFARAAGRNLGKIVSAIIYYVGFIMIAFTKKKQALHDMMANCVAVKK